MPDVKFKVRNYPAGATQLSVTAHESQIRGDRVGKYRKGPHRRRNHPLKIVSITPPTVANPFFVVTIDKDTLPSNYVLRVSVSGGGANAKGRHQAKRF